MGKTTTQPGGNRLEVKLLGVPEIRWQGLPLEPASAKNRALLYYLAARPEGASRDELEELFWGLGRRGSVRQALHSLRKLPGAEAWLGTDQRVTLRAQSDLAAFFEAMHESRYGEALELWEAAAVPGRSREALLWGVAPKKAPAFADWLEVERARLEALYLDALKCRALELEAAGRFAEALELSHRLLTEDNLNESAYRTAMRLHYRRGELEAAHALFEGCRRVLAEELGAEPLEETAELAQAIERGGRSQAEVAGDRAQLVLPTHSLFNQSPPAQGRIPPQLLRPPALVGREAALRKMERAWRAGLAIFVSGAAGMGKTRLLDFARSKGSFVLSEGLPGDAAVAYSSAARTLEHTLIATPLKLEGWVRQELARLLPERFPGLKPPSADGPHAKERFLWAFASVVDALGVDALLGDDLHLYDHASRDLILTLASRFGARHAAAPPKAPRLLATFRSEELGAAHRAAISAMVARGHALLIELEPLGPAALKRLLESLELPGLASQALAERLHRYTGGNPMFVLETVRGMAASGKVSEAFVLALPGRVEAVVRQRLGSLSPTTLKLAGAVAVVQPCAEPELLAQLLELDTLTVVDALGELERAHIMGDGRFVHDLWRDALLKTMPGAAKDLLHRRLALALEEKGAEPAQVALHWLAAKEASRAAPFFLRAATGAAQIYADDEAKWHFFQALWTGQDAELRKDALLGLEALAARTGDLALRGEALEALARLAFELQDDGLFFRLALCRTSYEVTLGKPREAMALAEDALAIARRLERRDLCAEAALQLGGAAFHAGELDAAQTAFERAAGTEVDAGLRLRAVNNLGAIAGIRGDLATAYRCGSEALTLARRGGDLSQVAALLNNLGATAERLARYTEARTSFGEATQLFARSRDERNRSLALLNRAEVEMRQGAYGAAWHAAAEGLALAQEQALPQLLVRAHAVGGALERALGRLDEAHARFALALATAAEAGDKRSQAIIRFNLELCAGEGSAAPTPTALEALGLRDVLPWAYADLALCAASPEETRLWAARILETRDNAHLRLLAALAEQRAARLEDPEAGPVSALESALESCIVAESPAGYRLLARAYAARDPRRAKALLERARALLHEQAEALPGPARRSLLAQS